MTAAERDEIAAWLGFSSWDAYTAWWEQEMLQHAAALGVKTAVVRQGAPTATRDPPSKAADRKFRFQFRYPKARIVWLPLIVPVLPASATHGSIGVRST